MYIAWPKNVVDLITVDEGGQQCIKYMDTVPSKEAAEGLDEAEDTTEGCFGGKV